MPYHFSRPELDRWPSSKKSKIFRKKSKKNPKKIKISQISQKKSKKSKNLPDSKLVTTI
jgi:hypothetical protein